MPVQKRMSTTELKNWLKNFERRTETFRKRVVSEPGKQAEAAQGLAMALAPEKTGTLVNAISWKVANLSKTVGTAMLWVKPLINPIDKSSVRTRGKASAYAGIHHSLALGNYSRGQARTGDPHWLFTVREEIKRRYKKALLGHIQKFR